MFGVFRRLPSPLISSVDIELEQEHRLSGEPAWVYVNPSVSPGMLLTAKCLGYHFQDDDLRRWRCGDLLSGSCFCQLSWPGVARNSGASCNDSEISPLPPDTPLD